MCVCIYIYIYIYTYLRRIHPRGPDPEEELDSTSDSLHVYKIQHTHEQTNKHIINKKQHSIHMALLIVISYIIYNTYTDDSLYT